LKQAAYHVARITSRSGSERKTVRARVVTVGKRQYSVSQKSSPPLKLFAIFLLRLSIFLWNFANLLPVYIHTCLPVLLDLT